MNHLFVLVKFFLLVVLEFLLVSILHFDVQYAKMQMNSGRRRYLNCGHAVSSDSYQTSFHTANTLGTNVNLTVEIWILLNAVIDKINQKTKIAYKLCENVTSHPNRI